MIEIYKAETVVEKKNSLEVRKEKKRNIRNFYIRCLLPYFLSFSYPKRWNAFMRKLYFALYYHWPLSKLTHFDIFTSLLRRTVAEKKI